jgi:D-alanyl-D-alanine carboxypeptidase/D-alanyl-D-alanine-endopeptidase (penicillin-binding protein 4)
MKIHSFLAVYWYFLAQTVQAQDPSAALAGALASLEKDPQMVHGIAALHVVDLKTGAVVFDRNGQLGLAPASAQKVVTAAAALDMLGSGFRYRTVFGYTDTVVNGNLLGDIVVRGSGDPTLGSDRFPQARSAQLIRSLSRAMQSRGIRKVEGGIVGIASRQESLAIPRGWIWEDVANYYGAGHGSLNWRENQFDLWLKPGARAGDPVVLLSAGGERLSAGDAGIFSSAASASASGYSASYFSNELMTGPKNSGDNAYLFFNPGQEGYTVRGTVPCCVDSFRISGAVSDPVRWTLDELGRAIGITGEVRVIRVDAPSAALKVQPLFTHVSPSLDSIVYWFLQKSINLYGEALVHTIAGEKGGFAAYESGLHMIRSYWKDRGIDTAAMNIMDGSGLSPQNRVTAKALTQVMRYARSREWYPSFYAALPVYNGIKMKSGTIGDVKSYTGYIKSQSGREFAFTIMVNNFTGSAASINRKMWKVLDVLK